MLNFLMRGALVLGGAGAALGAGAAWVSVAVAWRSAVAVRSVRVA